MSSSSPPPRRGRPSPWAAALAAVQRGRPCGRCRRPAVVCVCDRVAPVALGVPLVVLRHPREQDHMLGSAALLADCLEGAHLATGLAWRDLAHARGLSPARRRPAGQGGARARWAVVFPRGWPASGRPPPGAAEVVASDGAPWPVHAVAGLVLLDGTWSQAKTLWWRNPWLLSLVRLRLGPAQPSAYGRLRRQPAPDCLSTLEAAAAAAEAVGGSTAAAEQLRRLLRTMVQRARDAAAAEMAGAARALAKPRGLRQDRSPRAVAGG